MIRILTGRLIHANDVLAVPCRSTKYDLHLLSTGETTNRVVQDELGLKTKVGEVRLDVATNERAEETKALRLTGVNLDGLLEITLDELIARQLDVLRRRAVLERNLKLARLLELLTGEGLLDEALLTLDDDQRAILRLLFLLRGDAVGLHHILQIPAGLETPQYVLEWRLVVINMVESVLSNVPDDQVRVLPDLTTLVGLGVADEQVD